MYYNLSWSSQFRRVPKKTAFSSPLFFQAPTKTAIQEAGVKKVKGRCVKSTPLSKIKIGKRKTFLVGDPFKFKGAPQEEVVFGRNRFLKIMINPQVTLFVWINHYNVCYAFKPL